MKLYCKTPSNREQLFSSKHFTLGCYCLMGSAGCLMVSVIVLCCSVKTQQILFCHCLLCAKSSSLPFVVGMSSGFSQIAYRWSECM